jgi:hypothetical protein
MLNFDFKKSSRKCCLSEREFQPGEEFYSALLECDDGTTQRLDYSAEKWEGPPENCLGWWKSQVPDLGKGRVYWAPKDVLLAYFDHVRSNPQTQDVAYVTALLLAQKKILMIVDDGGDGSQVVLSNRSTKETCEVPVVKIEPTRLIEIQNELSERLFMDQPVESDAKDEPEID